MAKCIRCSVGDDKKLSVGTVYIRKCYDCGKKYCPMCESRGSTACPSCGSENTETAR